jgi:hypothetical protein
MLQLTSLRADEKHIVYAGNKMLACAGLLLLRMTFLPLIILSIFIPSASKPVPSVAEQPAVVMLWG